MYEDQIRYVIEKYKKLYGFDLSYMRFKTDSQPVYTNGDPCYEYDLDECAGDWTKLGWIRLNPDMPSVMRRYGVEGVSEGDFAKSIIAHELAHELYNNVADETFIENSVGIARKTGFTTPYLKTVRPNKMREETFCEWMAYRIADIVPHSSAAKQIDFPGGEAEPRGGEILTFMQVGRFRLDYLLNAIQTYTDNPRFDIEQFKKYLAPDRALATLWYGCFDKSGKCLALAVLKKYFRDDVILLAEIQSVVKGYGKPLIENILSRSKNIWWCADPDGGKSLIQYYRQFGASEILIRRSKWVEYRPEIAFYKAEDPAAERFIVDNIKKADMATPED